MEREIQMKVIVKLSDRCEHFEVRNTARGKSMGIFCSVESAKSCISRLVSTDIKDCIDSHYDVTSLTTGEIMYEYNSDNSGEFKIDDLRATIIRLLRGEIEETLNASFIGAPSRYVLQRVSELSEILVKRLHPDWC